MRREFGDLQNLPQDLRSFGRFCGPQTLFAWDLDNPAAENRLKMPDKLCRMFILPLEFGKGESSVPTTLRTSSLHQRRMAQIL